MTEPPQHPPIGPVDPREQGERRPGQPVGEAGAGEAGGQRNPVAEPTPPVAGSEPVAGPREDRAEDASGTAPALGSAGAAPHERDSAAPAVVAVGERPGAYDPEHPGDAAVIPAEPRPSRRRGGFLRELPILLVVAVVLALLIKTFLVQAFFIPSGSMEQTLHIHDRVLVNKLSFRTGSPQRGEVVVFNTAGTAFADPNSGEYLPCPPSNPVVSGIRAAQRFIGVGTCGEDDFIKRIIAVPGDTVQGIAGGAVVVDGHPLTEPYVYQNDHAAFCRASFEATQTPGGSYNPGDCATNPQPITVPAGMYWVMGDHRDDSEDSRYKGFVPRSKLVGRAFVRIYPLSRLGFLRVPSAFKGAGAALVGVAGTPALAAPALAVPLVVGRLRRRRRRRG